MSAEDLLRLMLEFEAARAENTKRAYEILEIVKGVCVGNTCLEIGIDPEQGDVVVWVQREVTQ